MNTGIKDAFMAEILAILYGHPGLERVVLFGSRATGHFTATSDLDLCLFGEALTLTDLAILADRIADLPMAQRVDLVLFHQLTDRKLIETIKQTGIFLPSTLSKLRDKTSIMG